MADTSPNDAAVVCGARFLSTDELLAHVVCDQAAEHQGMHSFADESSGTELRWLRQPDEL